MDLRVVFEQVLKVLNKLNKKQRIIILSTIIILISFLTYLILFRVETHNEYENYDVLFSNLSPEDSAAILQKLQQEKISYKIPEDNIILVPKDKVYEQRINMSSLGCQGQVTMSALIFCLKIMLEIHHSHKRQRRLS